jgi:hypothetical protein
MTTDKEMAVYGNGVFIVVYCRGGECVYVFAGNIEPNFNITYIFYNK